MGKRRIWLPPSASITQSSFKPLRPVLKRIFVRSGDQSGATPPAAKSCGFDPSAFITPIELPSARIAMNASCLPSGDQSASPFWPSEVS
jgi:hypothetical protein